MVLEVVEGEPLRPVQVEEVELVELHPSVGERANGRGAAGDGTGEGAVEAVVVVAVSRGGDPQGPVLTSATWCRKRAPSSGSASTSRSTW